MGSNSECAQSWFANLHRLDCFSQLHTPSLNLINNAKLQNWQHLGIFFFFSNNIDLKYRLHSLHEQETIKLNVVSSYTDKFDFKT